MDNGVVVAIASIATGIIAGSITLLSKLIDAFQKKSEQSMIIKTTYVNKKIEAGQRFINHNNILIYNRNLIMQYLISLKTSLSNSDQYIEQYKTGEEKITEATFSGESYIDLYFDLNELQQRSNNIIDELNCIMPLIEPNTATCREENYFENVSKAITLADDLLTTYRAMNKKVREDLIKYDIA